MTAADQFHPARLAAPAALDIDLDGPHGRELLVATAQRHGAQLTSIARGLDRLFLLRSPWAPGLRFAGGQISRIAADGYRHAFSLSGPAETVDGALASCLGEGVELISQIERAGDCIFAAPLAEVASCVMPDVVTSVRELLAERGDAGLSIGWIVARTPDGGEILVPADWCLRRTPSRAPFAPPWKVGNGVAAGPTWERAAMRAVLELIERDAVALWWLGGKRGRPLALHDPAVAEAGRLASALRQGRDWRVSWLLDITTDLGVPCIAAISTDSGGRGVVCGFAARPTLLEAAQGALLENAQMELALMLDLARDADKPRDGQHPPAATAGTASKLAAGIDASCDLLHPLGPPLAPNVESGIGMLDGLCGRLAEHDVGVSLVEHTRPDLGVFVVRAIAPRLQAVPCPIITRRLRDVLLETGGGTRFTHGLALF